MTPVLPRNKVSPSSRALRPSSKSLVGPHTNQLRNLWLPGSRSSRAARGLANSGVLQGLTCQGESGAAR